MFHRIRCNNKRSIKQYFDALCIEEASLIVYQHLRLISIAKCIRFFFKKQKHNFVRAAIHTAYTIPGLNGSQNRGTNFDCFYGFESPRNRKKEKQVYIITPKCNLISKFMDIFSLYNSYHSNLSITFFTAHAFKCNLL